MRADNIDSNVSSVGKLAQLFPLPREANRDRMLTGGAVAEGMIVRCPWGGSAIHGRVSVATSSVYA